MRQPRQRSRFEGELQRTLSAMQKQSFEKRIERVEQASGPRRKLAPAPFSIRKLHLPHPNNWLRGWPSSQAITKPRLGPMLDCVPGVFDIARSSTQYTPQTLRTDCPVLYHQITDSTELARIVCDQCQVEAARMGGNKQVVSTDHRAKRLQVCANLGIMQTHLIRKI